MLFDDENLHREKNVEERRMRGEWRGEWFDCNVNIKLMQECKKEDCSKYELVRL